MTDVPRPIVEAQRFELVASVLRPGLTELLRASDIVITDRAATLIQAAAVVEWLIAQCELVAVGYRAVAWQSE